MLDVTARERHKLVGLEKVKHTLAKQIRDNADVVPEVESVPEMYALVAIVLVVGCKGRENPQLNARCIPVFLNRSDDLDSHLCLAPAIVCLDDFAERALTEQLDD